ncbi:Coenzyme PQQ synthesis protein E [Sulfuracidifex tepidarius]|uniref:Probable GTP 3',8-cyclase n=1 Tax=Sulfuracidifex tepidarius TaxID=1294262 RepID=A0A510DUT5_9CREN|nr:GTP 3',8-cyclase MoaA [Sulfuracidifex tepidarius]BBG23924.1 Coenzyme PQQ synthesis protein E [Sulfuracidifex tepidarius]
MLDRFGRPVEDLRITLTHTCNFKCFFCHMEGEGDAVSGVSRRGIFRVTEISRDYGVRSVKLTGGEPTLRKDLFQIISDISSLGLEVSMTTNGFLLSSIAGKLKEAGLSRVNVSLHGSDPTSFKAVTGVDAFQRVIDGIKAALEYHLRPLKVNIVVTRKNLSDIENLLSMVERIGVDEVHLIEMHPVGHGREAFENHIFLKDLEEKLEKVSVRKELRSKHMRPRYVMSSGMVIEVVKPYANPLFCAGCNRIRLTADGKLKTCLYRDERVIDISSVLDEIDDVAYPLIRSAFEIAIAIREPNFKYKL